jgi:CheY-like chemotaxis protein
MTNLNDVVAIVDDDAGVRGSLKFLLEAVGYRGNTYSFAAAFLDDRSVRPGSLIVDSQMPVMTGPELAAQLRGEGTSITDAGVEPAEAMMHLDVQDKSCSWPTWGNSILRIPVRLHCRWDN